MVIRTPTAATPARSRDNGKANFAPYFFPDDKRIIFASNQLDPQRPQLRPLRDRRRRHGTRSGSRTTLELRRLPDVLARREVARVRQQPRRQPGRTRRTCSSPTGCRRARPSRARGPAAAVGPRGSGGLPPAAARLPEPLRNLAAGPLARDGRALRRAARDSAERKDGLVVAGLRATSKVGRPGSACRCRPRGRWDRAARPSCRRPAGRTWAR